MHTEDTRSRVLARARVYVRAVRIQPVREERKPIRHRRPGRHTPTISYNIITTTTNFLINKFRPQFGRRSFQNASSSGGRVRRRGRLVQTAIRRVTSATLSAVPTHPLNLDRS